MKTIKLSNPPWWWVLFGASVPIFMSAKAGTGVGPGMTMTPTVDGITVFLWALGAAVVWFAASGVRQTLRGLVLGLKKRRKHRQEGRDLAAFAGDYPVLAEPVVPAKRRKYSDPGGLVPSWIATKCRIEKDGKVSLELARDSFRMFCVQQSRDGNPHTPPNNNHWLPGVLRELGYKVAYLPKNKDDPDSKPGRGVYGLTVR